MLRFSLLGFLASGIFLGRAYFDYFFSVIACVIILKALTLERALQELEETEDAGEEPAGEEILAPNGG
jgi:hypothetical protein